MNNVYKMIVVQVCLSPIMKVHCCKVAKIHAGEENHCARRGDFKAPLGFRLLWDKDKLQWVKVSKRYNMTDP